MSDLINELVDILSEFTQYQQEKSFRDIMEDALCHNSVCSIDECVHCGRVIRAIRLIERAKDHVR